MPASATSRLKNLVPWTVRSALKEGFFRLTRPRRHGWVEVSRQHLRWRLNLDHYIDAEIYRQGEFEPVSTQWAKDFLRPGMHVLDVGANVGYFTLLMAQAVGPTGKVWAFEPTPDYFARAQAHVRANGFEDRVQLHNLGLSDHAQSLTITINESSATLHPVETHPHDQSQTIQLDTLDALAPKLGLQKLDFVKIDIDGHEPAMLRGGAQTLRKFHPAILIEFSQANLDVAGSDARQLHDQLSDLGYVLHNEKTRQPFPSRREFLRECANYTHSANVWAFANPAQAPRLAA